MRRRRAAALAIVVVLVTTAVILTTGSGAPSTTTSATGSKAPATGSGTAAASGSASTGTALSTSGHPSARARSLAGRSGPPSIEAGIESWTIGAPLSRASVVADGSGLTVLGGLNAAGTSLASVSTIDTTSGAVSAASRLADPVHDAAAVSLGRSTYVLGGGSPDTVGTIQSVGTPSIPPRAAVTGVAAGQLPQPRSDLAVASVGRVAYVVGGYDGATYLPQVLATTDGTRFTTAASLAVPVRYAAVVAYGGEIYAFGGQTAAAGSAVTATDDIQRIDPATHRVTVIGHLPQALYGAGAFVIDGTIYVAGGQLAGGTTLTQIYAFLPSTHTVLDAGLLPQADAFAGYATVGTGSRAVGYLVGGEVASQTGNDQAGIANGTLDSIISLRPSRYGGPAGGPGAGSPYAGTLLIADRGNDRLIALNTARETTWQYPSASAPPPPGGFYFPDDAFFIHKGTGIISNQENNHTIVEIGYPSGKILWQYGHPGVPGAGAGYLDQPDDAYLLKSGIITVADASNNRILFISPAGTVIGQIGNGTDAHVPTTSIAYPNGDTPLADGNVLVSEINGSWIDEYTQTGRMVWTVHMTTVNYPSDPQQLGSDLYLMTDYNPPGEGRVLEFTRQGQIPWIYDAQSGDAALKMPSLAERLPNGLIIVNDDYRDRVVVIDPLTYSIVWQYGLTDVSGTAPGMLSIPDGFDNLLADGTTPTHPVTG